MDQVTFQKLTEDKLQSIQDCILPEDTGNDLRKVSQFHDVVQDYVSFIVNFIEHYDLSGLKGALDRKWHLSWLDDYLENTKVENSIEKRIFQGFKGFDYGPRHRTVVINAHSDLSKYSEEAKTVAKFLYRTLAHYLKINPIRSQNNPINEKEATQEEYSHSKVPISKKPIKKDLRLIFDGHYLYEKTDPSKNIEIRSGFPKMLLLKLLESDGEEVLVRMIDNDYKNKMKSLKKHWGKVFGVSPKTISDILGWNNNKVKITEFLTFEGGIRGD